MYVTAATSFRDHTNPIVFPMATGVRPEASSLRRLKAGQALFCEGDSADCVYQVVEGVVRTSKMLSNGRRQILAFGYPEDIVGLSHDQCYHSDCEAVSDTKLRVLRKNASSARFNFDVEICDQLLRHAAAEVSGMQDHFLMLGRKSAMEKIASFLLVLAQRTGTHTQGEVCVPLPMTRSDIADFLGLTVETVSRTLTKLKSGHVIRLPDHHSVCIRRMAALEDLADSNE